MNTQSPLFPVMCLVLALIAVTQLVLNLVIAVTSISSFLVSTCAKMDKAFFSDLMAGVYAV